MTIDHAARTDRGQVRSQNEDHLVAAPDMGLFVVADGMGGHKGGAEASRLACEVVESYIRQRLSIVEGYAREGTPGRRRQMMYLVSEAARAANDRILAEADERAELAGMGSTVVILLMVADHAFVGHVGDSRVYLLRNGVTTLLTEDHSLLFELVRQGRLSRAAAARFPLKNVVTRALGVRGAVEADCLDVEVLPGDRFLLCSDGLHGYAGDDAIQLMAGEGPLDAAVNRLVDFANNAGGSDNISALLVEVQRLDGDGVAALERLRHGRSMPFFQGLGLGEWLRLMARCEHRQCAEGEELFHEGGNGDGLYAVLAGSVAVVRNGQVVQRFGPGTHFGEMSLMEERPRMVSAVAEVPSQVVILPRRTFESLVDQSPLLAARMMRQLVLILAKRLRTTNDELVVTRAFLNKGTRAPAVVLPSEALEEEDR